MMDRENINKKLEIIEQSRQYMHRMVDAQYDEFIRQSQNIADEETENLEEIAPQLVM